MNNLNDLSLFELLKTGGATVVILLLCSVVSLAIALERFFYYLKRSKTKLEDFMPRVKEALKDKDTQRALQICVMSEAPFSKVAQKGIAQWGHSETTVSNAMEREIALETSKLQRGIGINGTIGSVAVYIGLFGTVLGIIRAFHDISQKSSGGMNVVINGISEALICTAVGLVVAVPAVIFYNYFIKRIDSFVLDMELCASEILDLSRDSK